jgi:hypothetical protein
VPEAGWTGSQRERAAGTDHRGNGGRRGRRQSDRGRVAPGKGHGRHCGGAVDRPRRAPRSDGPPLPGCLPHPCRRRGPGHDGARIAGRRGGHRPGARRLDARNDRRRTQHRNGLPPGHGHGRDRPPAAAHRGGPAGRRAGRRVGWGEIPRNPDGDRGRWGRSNGPGDGRWDGDLGTGSWGAGRRVG